MLAFHPARILLLQAKARAAEVAELKIKVEETFNKSYLVSAAAAFAVVGLMILGAYAQHVLFTDLQDLLGQIEAASRL